MKTRLQILLLVTAAVVMVVVAACGDTDDADTSPIELAETGHEGHNHAPGEHQATEAAVADQPLDWCYEHSVPESQCTRCHPELIEHYVESKDWCAGHDLPESHCRLCNPGIVFPQEDVLRARAAEFTDREIDIRLNFRPNAELCATDGAIIQFASATTADRAGITTQAIRTATRRAIEEAPAEVLFDETRTAAITTTVSAMVTRWLVSPGDQVASGDVLAILQSPEISDLRSELVTARANHRVHQKDLERHERMMEQDLISEADFDQVAARAEQAHAEYISTRGRLMAAGLNESDLNDILEHGSMSNRFALRAPDDGIIIDRIAPLGELLDAGRALATIGDPGALWIEARLSERQMREVEIGGELTFSSDGGGLNRVGGEIIWISRFLDPHTRTGTVRARVIDPHHSLRAGEFGRARIVNSGHGNVMLVPRDAVQWEGCCNVVFLRETDDRYRPRKVDLIDSDGPFYQVDGGVRVGDQVVVDGAFLLKTELKKSSIGAGCCGLDPAG